MDTPTHKVPTVMRPAQFGQASSHVTRAPVAHSPRGKGWGLMARLGIGGKKVI